MDFGFSVSDIENMSKLLGCSNTDTQLDQQTAHNYENTGSILNPNQIGTNLKKENKELAEPNFKINATFNRLTNKPENDIWNEKDFKKEDNIIEDGRKQPEYDVLFKQTVGAEDVYFGLSGKDNSSNCCDELSIKIKLPDTNIKEISIEVKQQSIHLNVRLINNINYITSLIESQICFESYITLSS